MLKELCKGKLWYFLLSISYVSLVCKFTFKELLEWTFQGFCCLNLLESYFCSVFAFAFSHSLQERLSKWSFFSIPEVFVAQDEDWHKTLRWKVLQALMHEDSDHIYGAKERSNWEEELFKELSFVILDQSLPQFDNQICESFFCVAIRTLYNIKTSLGILLYNHIATYVLN